MKPKIAMPNSVAGADYKAAGYFAKKHNFEAIEWSLDRIRIPLQIDNRLFFFKVIKKASSEYRFHAPFYDMDIGYKDPQLNQAFMSMMRMYIDFLGELGKTYFTLHVSSQGSELSWQKAIENLRELVEYGHEREIIVSVENLCSGPTSDPDKLLELVSQTGAMVTFDLGHVIGGEWLKSGRGTAVDFLKKILSFVRTAHIYETEEGNPPQHVAPKDISIIGPTLKVLLESECDFWLIELWTNKKELLSTRKLIDGFLYENYK